MPEIFLSLSNPADVSFPNDETAHGSATPTPPAGGLLGTGDLTTNDGDTSGFEAWNSNSAIYLDPGTDAFQYDLEPAALPSGATITGFRYEYTRRAVEASPQGYARLTMSLDYHPDWSPAYHEETGVPTAPDTFIYTDQGGDSITPPNDALKAAFMSGGIVVGFGAVSRNASQELGALRVTMAGIRLYYESGAVTRRRVPHLRGFQRGSDGQGITGGKRGIGNSSRQASIRRGPGSFY